MSAQHPYTHALLDAYRRQTDPTADQAVARLIDEQGPEEARRLFDLLIRRIETPINELPASLSSFWEDTDRLPEWTDWEQVRLANDLFADHGPKFLVFLYYKSLPLLYSDARGAKVLTQTGRLTHEDGRMAIFTRRIAETGQFLLTTMAPGALVPGGPGIRAIQKIRLIHAAIRQFIAIDGRWNEAAWGKPINQEDMALTLMTFSISLTDALPRFGIKEPETKNAAFLHLWTAIGQLLGVAPELLPANTALARQLLDTILERQTAPSEDGQALMQALLAFARDRLPEEYHALPELLTLHLIPQAQAQALGLRPSNGCLGMALPLILRKTFQLGEKLEDKVDDKLSVFIDRLAWKMMEKMVGYFDAYKQRNFTIPESLRNARGFQPVS